MTLLALLRHGETEWSADKRIQGRTDVPLNRAGRAALEDLAVPDMFGAMQVVTSPLQRCLQTAEALKLHPAAHEPRIAEMAWGQWEGRRLADLRQEFGRAMQANEARGFDFTPPQGESPRQVWARVSPWLCEIATQGTPTLAVSHRGVIRVIFAAALGWDLLGRPPARLDWSALQVFRLDPSGKPVVSDLNVPLACLPYER